MNDMRLGDLDKALEELCKYCSCGSYESCENRCVEFRNISNISTIDAVPVVRCPLCKYHMVYKEQDGEGSYLGCTRPWGLRGALAPEDFCSYGERRTDNG